MDNCYLFRSIIVVVDLVLPKRDMGDSKLYSSTIPAAAKSGLSQAHLRDRRLHPSQSRYSSGA
jgi:hypothetical protein